MEYTLAFSNVNTVAVFRSRPRNESRISMEGLAASSARIPESYFVVSEGLRLEDVTNDVDIHRRGCRLVLHTRPRPPAREG